MIEEYRLVAYNNIRRAAESPHGLWIPYECTVFDYVFNLCSRVKFYNALCMCVWMLFACIGPQSLEDKSRN